MKLGASAQMQTQKEEKMANKQKIDVIIPASGDGTRFVAAGYKICKPLIEVNGIPMLANVVKNLKSTLFDLHYHIILRKSHIENFKDDFDNLIKELASEKLNFIEIEKLTEGAACTVLFARNALSTNPIIVANSDQLVEFEIDTLIKDAMLRNLDGSILTFIDEDKNTKWSYVKTNSDNLVVEVAEKNPISNQATVGIYYFANGLEFVDSAVEMIIANKRHNNEFYLCPVYNEYIIKNKKVGIIKINKNQMHCLGTPEDLNNYININKK